MLADARLRARYDRHGAASLDVNFMDAGVFFTMLFGSERFEPYIERLALASAASMEGSLSMHRLQVRQQSARSTSPSSSSSSRRCTSRATSTRSRRRCVRRPRSSRPSRSARACCTLSPSCTPAERRSSSVTRPRCWG